MAGRVFVAPGNHDPYSASSLVASRDAAAERARLQRTRLARVPDLGEGVTLFGFGHTPAEPGRPFASARFDRPGVRIALVHGSDEERCPPHKRATAPFTAGEVTRAGANLLLDRSLPRRLRRARRQPANRSSPIPARPNRSSSANAARTARSSCAPTANAIEVEPVEIARTRLTDVACDLTGASSEPAVLAAVERALEACGADDYVRLRLTGEPLAGTRVDPALIAERFGGALGALDVRDDTVAYDYETIAREPTVRGRAVADLLALARDEDERAAADARRALRYCVAAFEGDSDRTVRLIDLRLSGFGKFADRTFAFDPGLVVVYGPNEAGKSTLASAIVATLYGAGRERDRWRPWSGARYGATLRYALGDGRAFEVQRDFERDPKGVRVYDRDGNDVTAATSQRRTVSPGSSHLGIPIEVFVNAACVRQGAVRIEGARAEVIGASLTRALDGGPRDDAALGAVARFERAIADHVGAKRATVNAPLRAIQRRLDETVARATEVRAAHAALTQLRATVDERAERAAALADRLRDYEQRARNVSAATLRDRLEALRKNRADTSALLAQRSAFDDVAAFQRAGVSPFAAQFARWHALASVAAGAEADALAARQGPADQSELEERRADGGALDDDAFAALRALTADAQRQREAATTAASAAATASRVADGGATALGAVGSAAVLVAVAAIVLAVVHTWATGDRRRGRRARVRRVDPARGPQAAPRRNRGDAPPN